MKKLLAIALTAMTLSILVQPTQANPAAVQAAIGACAANPGACAVVLGAAGTWVLWRNSPSILCTAYCREMRQQNTPDGSGKYAETTKLSKNRDGCKDMEKRLRQGGFKLTLIRMERNRSPGSFLEVKCVFGGDSREVGRFNQYWR